MGLALGTGLIFLIIWLRSRGVNLAWYELLTGLLGIALLLFAYQNYQASVAEFEPTAPGMFLLVFGLPGLILLLLSVFLVWFRNFRAACLAWFRNRRAPKDGRGSTKTAKA